MHNVPDRGDRGIEVVTPLSAVRPGVAREPSSPSVDTHSFARPEQVRVTHVQLDLTLDFDKREVDGVATLSLDRTDPSAPLYLDSDKLSIQSIMGMDKSGLLTQRSFEIGVSDAVVGTPIRVALGSDDTSVVIIYTTSPDAAAMQWLDPEQTSTGKHPFVYTQGQAILTRSWIPLQDSPGVRVTYDATVHCPAELRTVMSAEQSEQMPDGSYRFSMSRAIPPYLIALACGELVRAKISPRVAVYAEPPVIDLAAAEFEDTEAMIQASEEMFGPYRWGRYDMLVLPPSFPFGGMENPCLTFATPTILAGDKSLVGLIAHELAHSWSGNLVTNATWRDFWLNEGFTVYLEQRIMERVYGAPRSAMETLLGMRGLKDELAELPREDQVLHIDLVGRNPDDGMTTVAYDKGAAFLRRLEEAFGRKAFDEFLQKWFNQHAWQSLTTDRFLTFLNRELLRRNPEAAALVDVDEWVNSPGLPSDAPMPRSPAFQVVNQAREAWLGGADAHGLSTAEWNTQQWLHFLALMPESVGAARMTKLDDAFRFTRSKNSEILASWLKLAIVNDYTPAMRRLDLFLMTVGRRKFLVPLYAALNEHNPAKAKELYDRARPRYHAVSRGTLDDMLRGEE